MMEKILLKNRLPMYRIEDIASNMAVGIFKSLENGFELLKNEALLDFEKNPFQIPFQAIVHNNFVSEFGILLANNNLYTKIYVDGILMPNDITDFQNDLDLSIISVLMKKYDDWNRLYKALSADYNPIHNYDMVETEIGDDKKSKSNSINSTSSQNDDATITGKQTQVETGTGGNTQKIYGYNSSDAVPSGESTATSNSNASVDKTDTTTRNVTGKSTQQNNERENVNTNRKLTRSGNIGVTTSQQMIQSEIDLRTQSFLKIVFKDLAREFTIPFWY